MYSYFPLFSITKLTYNNLLMGQAGVAPAPFGLRLPTALLLCYRHKYFNKQTKLLNPHGVYLPTWTEDIVPQSGSVLCGMMESNHRLQTYVSWYFVIKLIPVVLSFYYVFYRCGTLHTLLRIF